MGAYFLQFSFFFALEIIVVRQKIFQQIEFLMIYHIHYIVTFMSLVRVRVAIRI